MVGCSWWSCLVSAAPTMFSCLLLTVLASMESLSSRLKEQQQERAKTIQKLKDATKYDTTQELLEKYGGGEPVPTKSLVAPDTNEQKGKHSAAELPNPESRPGSRQDMPSRTRMPPPPTANIPRQADGPPESIPQHVHKRPSKDGHVSENFSGASPSGVPTSAEFAPNAYNDAPLPPVDQYATTQDGPHWYDRILDILLGEDETAPKNRIILICRVCRQVNGQAPPGTKSLAELGTWRCVSCHVLNGEMDEGEKLVREVLESQTKRQGRSESLSGDSDAATRPNEVILNEEEHSKINRKSPNLRRRKDQTTS
jgi:hypothetical protein